MHLAIQIRPGELPYKFKLAFAHPAFASFFFALSFANAFPICASVFSAST